jgi:hypothetical protein
MVVKIDVVKNLNVISDFFNANGTLPVAFLRKLRSVMPVVQTTKQTKPDSIFCYRALL